MCVYFEVKEKVDEYVFFSAKLVMQKLRGAFVFFTERKLGVGLGNGMCWILTWAAHTGDLFYDVRDKHVKTVYRLTHFPFPVLFGDPSGAEITHFTF